jgi:hypothetical protein
LEKTRPYGADGRRVFFEEKWLATKKKDQPSMIWKWFENAVADDVAVFDCVAEVVIVSAVVNGVAVAGAAVVYWLRKKVLIYMTVKRIGG